jgi:hypothetical protein
MSEDLSEELTEALRRAFATVTPEQVKSAAEARKQRGFRPGLVTARPRGGVPGLVATFQADDDLHEPQWELSGVVARQGDELVIAELTLRSHPNRGQIADGGVTRSVLAEIKIPALLRGVQMSLREHDRLVRIGQERHGDMADYAALAERAAAMASEADVSGKPGRKGHDVALYRDLAFQYLKLQGELMAEGAKTPRGIIQRLAEKPWRADLDRNLTEVPTDTVKSRLRKCRELGLLTFDGAGHAGAQPGPNLFDESTKETS